MPAFLCGFAVAPNRITPFLFKRSSISPADDEGIEQAWSFDVSDIGYATALTTEKNQAFVWVAGYFRKNILIGTYQLSAVDPGSNNWVMFLAKFDTRNNSIVLALTHEGVKSATRDNDILACALVSLAGSVYVAATFSSGSIDFGQGVNITKDDSWAKTGFLLRLNASSGEADYVLRWGGVGIDTMRLGALSGKGQALVLGGGLGTGMWQANQAYPRLLSSGSNLAGKVSNFLVRPYDGGPIDATTNPTGWPVDSSIGYTSYGMAILLLEDPCVGNNFCASLHRQACGTNSIVCGACQQGFTHPLQEGLEACRPVSCSLSKIECSRLGRGACQDGNLDDTCLGCLKNYETSSGQAADVQSPGNSPCIARCFTRSPADCKALNRHPCEPNRTLWGEGTSEIWEDLCGACLEDYGLPGHGEADSTDAWGNTYCQSAALLLDEGVSIDKVGLALASLFGSLTMLWVALWLLKLRHLYPEANHGAMIEVLLALFDVITDILFCVSVSDYSDNPVFFRASLALLLFSTFAALAGNILLLRTEFKTNTKFSSWFVEHTSTGVPIFLVASTNSSVLSLLNSRLFDMDRFSAPLSVNGKRLLAISGLTSNILEDLPQFCIQLAFLLHSQDALGTLTKVITGRISRRDRGTDTPTPTSTSIKTQTHFFLLFIFFKNFFFLFPPTFFSCTLGFNFCLGLFVFRLPWVLVRCGAKGAPGVSI